MPNISFPRTVNIHPSLKNKIKKWMWNRVADIHFHLATFNMLLITMTSPRFSTISSWLHCLWIHGKFVLELVFGSIQQLLWMNRFRPSMSLTEYSEYLFYKPHFRDWVCFSLTKMFGSVELHIRSLIIIGGAGDAAFSSLLSPQFYFHVGSFHSWQQESQENSNAEMATNLLVQDSWEFLAHLVLKCGNLSILDSGCSVYLGPS